VDGLRRPRPRPLGRNALRRVRVEGPPLGRVVAEVAGPSSHLGGVREWRHRDRQGGRADAVRDPGHRGPIASMGAACLEPRHPVSGGSGDPPIPRRRGGHRAKPEIGVVASR
jgi:hypothetical protein